MDVLSQNLEEDELVMLAHQLKDSVIGAASLDTADNTGKATLKVQIRSKLLKFRPQLGCSSEEFESLVGEVFAHLEDLSL